MLRKFHCFGSGVFMLPVLPSLIPEYNDTLLGKRLLGFVVNLLLPIAQWILSGQEIVTCKRYGLCGFFK